MSKIKAQIRLTRRQFVQWSAAASAAILGALRQVPHPAAAQSGVAEEVFVGPFASWSDVKTKYGARGDGVADDTRALQAALDVLGNEDVSPVLWLPAGTYRITQTLTWTRNIGDGQMSILGEHPATTRIVWDGAADGVMFQTHNINNSRFGRLTWDGQGRAAYAVQHTSSGSSSGNEHTDEYFENVGVGIRGGTMDTAMVAEMSVRRCHFSNCTRAGISIENPNSLDWWIWDSAFTDCYVGVTTGYGQGNFHVFQSVFKRSTFADTLLGFGLNHVFADNYSENSRAFCLASFSLNTLPLVMQRNTIVDATLGVNPPEPRGGGLDVLFPYELKGPIAVKYFGPMVLLDNVIRSRVGQGAPVVEVGADLLAVGNRVTAANALQAGARRLELDTQVRAAASVDVSEPVLPGVPPKFTGAIFEVGANATAAEIQTQVNAAVKAGGRAAVHIPYGTHALAQTVMIPANCDIQITGDGRTFLDWIGGADAVALDVQAPSQVTLRDFVVRQNENIGTGIRVTGFDAAGARVLMQGVTARGFRYGLNVDGLDEALVELVDVSCPNAFYEPPIERERALVRVRGGSKRAQGLQSAGRLNWFSGSTSGTVPIIVVEGGGAGLVRALWYEGDAAQVVRLDEGGEFTMFGTLLARSARTKPGGAAIEVENFAGKVALFGLNFSDAETLGEDFVGVRVQGMGSGIRVLVLGAVGWVARVLGLENTAARAQAAFLLNRSVKKAGEYVVARADEDWNMGGSTRAQFVRALLEAARRERPRGHGGVGGGATDLRMYRVAVFGFDTAISLVGKG